MNGIRPMLKHTFFKYDRELTLAQHWSDVGNIRHRDNIGPKFVVL